MKKERERRSEKENKKKNESGKKIMESKKARGPNQGWTSVAQNERTNKPLGQRKRTVPACLLACLLDYREKEQP